MNLDADAKKEIMDRCEAALDAARPSDNSHEQITRSIAALTCAAAVACRNGELTLEQSMRAFELAWTDAKRVR